ncbi:response regulator transcription factor [Chloroflexota bacterium]
MKALIIDNSSDTIELVSLCFKLRWPNVDIAVSNTGEHGVELVETERPDIVILDIDLPDIDGFEVMRRIRLFSEVGAIILTERSKELDVLKGFELGADDYITKPFSQVGLLARVKAVLRRSRAFGMEESMEPFSQGGLHIDYTTRQITIKGKGLKLTPIEYSLLHHLTKNAGRVMTHSELLRKSQGPEYVEATENLKVYIQRLRRKIEEDPARPRLIITERGVGYIFARQR